MSAVMTVNSTYAYVILAGRVHIAIKWTLEVTVSRQIAATTVDTKLEQDRVIHQMAAARYLVAVSMLVRTILIQPVMHTVLQMRMYLLDVAREHCVKVRVENSLDSLVSKKK